MPNRLIMRILLLSPILLSLVWAGCGDDSADPDAGPPSADAGPPSADSGSPTDAGPLESDGRYLALIRGTLVPDPAAAEAVHDNLASAGEAPARAMGDIGHEAFLGTTLLGTPENEFLAIDRWVREDGVRSFYEAPELQEGFAALLEPPPSIERFVATDWHGWGDLDAADDASPHYFVVVRGRLAAPAAEAQAMHDAIAGGGEEMVRAAGDVAHLAYLGLDDDREFLAIDVWPHADAIEAVYGDPDFAAAFATLFDGAPSLRVYASTGWHEWQEEWR